MNEAEKKGEQGQELKGRNPATVSLVFAILSFLYAFLGMSMDVDFVDMMIGVVLCLAGIMSGIVALVRIKRVKGKLDGCFTGILGIAICAVLILIFLSVFYASQSRNKRAITLGVMVMCRSNLTALGTSVLIYANDFDGRYPAAERWCDLLLKHSEGELTEKSFRCPANKKERCSFAINPNCEPNSPEDVVLLFESRGGWNQYGGPELLAPQNHEGRGCNILFNDGHVYFENVKSIPKLNWGDEKGEK